MKGQIFKSMKYCSTKKEARHDAAMHAVLGLNIPVGKRPWSMSCVASALKFHHNVILDCAALIFQIKVKQAMYGKWENQF